MFVCKHDCTFLCITQQNIVFIRFDTSLNLKVRNDFPDAKI